MVRVNAEIERSLKAAEALLGQGKDEPAGKLMAEVEKLQNKLIHEKKERDAALQIVENFTAAKAKLDKAMEEYDAKAKEAIDTLNEAKSEKAANAAIRKSEELVSSNVNTASVDSSLAGLTKMAAKFRAEADVDAQMTDLGRSVAEKDKDVAAALALVDAGATANETPAEKLARLRSRQG